MRPQLEPGAQGIGETPDVGARHDVGRGQACQNRTIDRGMQVGDLVGQRQIEGLLAGMGLRVAEAVKRPKNAYRQHGDCRELKQALGAAFLLQCGAAGR